MIIDVQATRAKSEDEAPSHERYALKKTEQRLGLPVTFAAILTGLALYLKAIFPSFGSVDPQGAAEPAAADEAETAPLGAEIALLPSDIAGILPAGPAEEAELPESLGGSWATSVGLRPSEFALVDSPAIRLADITPQSAMPLSPIIPFLMPQSPVNDNGGTGVAPGGQSVLPFRPVVVAPPEDGDETPLPPRNRAPRLNGTVQLFDVFGCGAVLISLIELLRNATDPDGDTLFIRDISVSSGTLELIGGALRFTPASGMLGGVTVSYLVTDGEASVPQQAFFSVLPQPPIVGTNGDDLLIGSMCGDDIDGLDGHDNIDGRGGSDAISGGRGDDHIVAGSGNDFVLGGEGDDIIFGGDGNDILSGGDGHDRLFGDAGNDTLFGDAGNDTLRGGDGDDLIRGGTGDDIADGGAGRDIVFGDDGADRISGGDGDDVLDGGAGRDVVKGDAGNDLIVASLDDADDDYDGGTGIDTLDLSATTAGVDVDFIEGTASGAEIGSDSITSFERAIGGDGDDRFTVGEAPMVLAGGGGNDSFVFSMPELSAGTPALMHEILDFMVGDRILVAAYEIYKREREDEADDPFGSVYGDDGDQDARPIRFRHEKTDEMERTFVEADMDDDDWYEISINLDGHHLLWMNQDHG